MSFGTVLGELCSLCGIKRCNLADALGYDPSYISRWINNVKLPAADTHGELFCRMGEYVASAAAPSLRERAIARFSLHCTAEESDFSAAVTELLYRAYEETSSLPPPDVSIQAAKMPHSPLPQALPCSLKASFRYFAAAASPESP